MEGGIYFQIDFFVARLLLTEGTIFPLKARKQQTQLKKASDVNIYVPLKKRLSEGDYHHFPLKEGALIKFKF